MRASGGDDRLRSDREISRSGVVARFGARLVNYARHQQFRRLSRAGRLALAGMTTALLGLLLLRNGLATAGWILLGGAVVAGLRARHWFSLAARSRVGARSEEEVRRALEPLREHGWRLRHAVAWAGHGDIDSVVIAPTGVGFAIETKTRTYDHRQLGREQAHRRLRKSRPKRAAGAADRNAGPLRAWKCAPFANASAGCEASCQHPVRQ
jgi:Nuclease-related domain